MRAPLIALLLACCVCCASSPKVRIFSVPPCAAKGTMITVTWAANRPAILTASPAPPGWKNHEVPPRGNAEVAIDRDTELQLVLPGALSGRTAPAHAVKAFDASIAEQVNAPACDPATRRVTGRMQPVDSCATTVVRMSSPTTQGSSGESVPRRVCLVPPVGTEKCAEPRGSVVIDAKVDSSWSVSIPLREGESCGGTSQPSLAAMTFEVAP